VLLDSCEFLVQENFIFSLNTEQATILLHYNFYYPFNIASMQINSEDLKKINVDILTNKEKQKCYEAFVAFDKNASGYIEKDELRKVLEEMG
jgi:calmodulin